jgi:hypothetical protein
MRADKPQGICTHPYRCKRCGKVMYQVPPTPRYTPVVEHYCSAAGQVVELKPTKA